MIRCCRHIMSDGTRCKAPALASQPFCYQHNRLHRASSTKSGKKNQLTLRPLEDRRTVLLALSDVICGLAAGKIEPNTAARLIYGLQVASQVAADAPFLVLGKPIESVELSKNGDEMAPAVTLCTDEDHCETCADIADCPLKNAVKYRAEHRVTSDENEDEDDTDDGEENGADTDDDGDNDEDEDDDEEEDQDDDEEDEDDEDEDKNEKDAGDAPQRSAA